MRLLYSLVTALFIFNIAHADTPATDSATTTPGEVIQTMERKFGVHPGFRRNHAKGICATGEFKAAPAAKALSKSILFSGKSLPVIARFSLAGGVPATPDSENVPHGMALRFDLGKTGYHNMSMINVPIFPVGTPEGFLESLKLAGPEDVKNFINKHPESKPFFSYMGGTSPTASYATTAYYSLDAFKFTNSKGKDQYVRWEFKPEAGDKKLNKEELAKAASDYLATEFAERVKDGGSAKFDMIVTLAEPGDSLTNPSQSWKASDKTVKVGTLTLTKYSAQDGGPCNKLNFDPNHVSVGVAPSDDPILKFRSPAYALSFVKRTNEVPEKVPGLGSESGAKNK